MKQVKQSDNICTVNWRNIWGIFTLDELKTIKNTIPDCRLCSTQYTFMVDINHPDRLERYINNMIKDGKKPPKEWAYYIDYPKQFHDKIWGIINWNTLAQ
jgi:hypothetical protein